MDDGLVQGEVDGESFGLPRIDEVEAERVARKRLLAAQITYSENSSRSAFT